MLSVFVYVCVYFLRTYVCVCLFVCAWVIVDFVDTKYISGMLALVLLFAQVIVL